MKGRTIVGRVRRRFGAILTAVVVGAAVVGCGQATELGNDLPTDVPTASSSPVVTSSGSASAVATPFPSDPFASAPLPASPVAGVVTAVQAGASASAKPGDSASITGFTLRTTSGVELTFVIGQVDDLADFPLSSLADHASSLVPILVWFRVDGTDLVVNHLEDAG